MARKYKATRGKKRIPRRLYKRKYKVSVGKLLDSKINTTLERRMKKISLDVHNSQIIKLQFRQFLMGTFDRTTNIFGLGSKIDWTGQIMSCVQIQKLDNATSVTVAPAANVQQTPSSYINPGGNVIAPITGKDGFRTADYIKVTGISLDINIQQDRVLDTHASATNSVPTLIPPYSYADVWLSIVQWNELDSDLIAQKPNPMELLKVPIMGFSNKIDFEYAKEYLGAMLKKKTLWRQRIRMPIRLRNTTIRNKRVFLNFKDKPILVQYDSADQNGQEVIKNKLFFVVRSTIPAAAVYTPYKPRVRLVMKTHYNED